MDLGLQSSNNEKDTKEDSLKNSDDVWVLRVKAGGDVNVSIAPSANVSALKKSVLKTLNRDSSSYVRLICQGRMLAPDTAPISDFVQHEAVVHAVITKPQHGTGAQALLQQSGVVSRRLRGTGVSTDGRAIRNHSEDDSEIEDDDDDSDTELGTERLGLDRLRSTGISRNEIRTLRVYFNRSIEQWMRDNPDQAQAAAGTETDGVRRRLLQEDAWMATQGPASEFRLNLAGWSQVSNLRRAAQHDQMLRAGSGSVGTDRDFLWGFLLGFFVEYLMLVWVWMPSVPHKTKLGILTGISFKVGLGLLSPPEEEPEDYERMFPP